MTSIRAVLSLLMLGPASSMLPRPRTITDVIHRTIGVHPLCVRIMDTPEFQRLRHVRQLGTCSSVFPCAVHDRFQHSLGVAHLAESWTNFFREIQPELGINDRDVLCVTVRVHIGIPLRLSTGFWLFGSSLPLATHAVRWATPMALTYTACGGSSVPAS